MEKNERLQWGRVGCKWRGGGDGAENVRVRERASSNVQRKKKMRERGSSNVKRRTEKGRAVMC